jgi:23S rRNA (cytosine1962-C5)-methyltransferase
MTPPLLILKKGEERRVVAGHPWIFSNEIDVATTPLKNFSPGEEVGVYTQERKFVGMAYINPHSLIAARLFSTDINQRLGVSFLIQQMQRTYQLRERLFSQPYYRLAFGESDGLPGLIIDRFGDHVVCQINTAGMEKQKNQLTEAICNVLPSTQSILLRNDSSIRTQEGLETYIAPLYGNPPEEIELEENSVVFSAPLWQGQKTGWFYDHRFNRLRLKDYVADKHVLDVFSYLGAWGIQAAQFGAKKIDFIESSRFASDYILKNAQRHNIVDKINILCEDAFDAMRQLLKAGTTYDVIILDPPAFIKKRKDLKEGLLAYQRINELAFKLLKPEGILVTCSCSMQLAWEDFYQLLQRAAYRSRTTIQILERGHQAADHPVHSAIPETDYLKMIIGRKVE